ncbi:hypothetical protein HNR00_003610 [Methylorubrum rhodinum]|uniref:Uncharacterized protein n=1 Tax=Methylorubrum rhodinum TaxID=29428 RepID=A0A840ZQ97_9HYPH|nr:hypothetical protein [Methylorubrum rhodinum]MBB5758883.1 hypothetical protein [Methylorubrum rhodinum]
MSCWHAVSADEFARLLQAIELGNEADAARMPDEAAALKVMQAAYERLKALGFRDFTYCPKDGQYREFVEVGSTGVHSGYRDASGVWIAEAGDLWPSKPILFRDPHAPGMEARRAGTQGGPVHDSPIGVAEAPQPDPTPKAGE